jgi:hypothetical protein
LSDCLAERTEAILRMEGRGRKESVGGFEMIRSIRRGLVSEAWFKMKLKHDSWPSPVVGGRIRRPERQFQF